MQQLESYIHGGRTHIGFDVPKHWIARQRGRHGQVEATLHGATEVAQKQAAINQLIEGGTTHLPGIQPIKLFFADSALEVEPLSFPEGFPVANLIYSGHPEVRGGVHLRDQVRALDELAKSIAAALSNDSDDFDELAADWKQATTFISSPEEAAMHPSYQRIIGMGTTVLPRILEALEQEPDQWFWALRAIVGRDVAEGATTIAEAASTWVEWGRSLGLIGESSRSR